MKQLPEGVKDDDGTTTYTDRLELIVEGMVNGASMVSFILEVLSSMMLESDTVEAVILPP